MKIRKIKKEDIPTVTALTKEISEHERFEGFNVPESYFEENFLGDNRYADIYVIEADGVVIGMGHAIKMASTYIGGHEIFLRDFVITKEHRGKGYGKEFIKFLCQLAKDTHCKKVCWGVLDWNEEALNLYSKVSDVQHDVASCSIDAKRIKEILDERS